eukprot:TRINITY_DN8224_c0_g1_i1.p1 TRINITY_DN8224_c0_g1~~TRINITY_DN8224_c0_g1_i1.p1  ORF type:complete len:282 (-),score=42.27 TRINITY_DN8224_c0_g1_i1:36-812(-)
MNEWRNIIIVLLSTIALLIQPSQGQGFSELTLFELGTESYTIYQSQALLWLFVTNRPEEQTHPENFISSETTSDVMSTSTSSVSGVDTTSDDGIEDFHMKGIYNPRVDQISLLEVHGSYGNYATRTDLYVYLQIGDFKTSRKRYNRAGIVVGSWQAIATIENGNLTGIDWDDGCDECASDLNRCIDNSCGLDIIDDCQCENCPADVCNMKVYFAWFGTDSEGDVCISKGDLPSNLGIFSLGTVYDQAAGIQASKYTII